MLYPNTLNTLQVLLVEDNPADVMLTREAVKSYKIPHQLHVVEDGENALRFLRHEAPFNNVPTPHLMMLDLNLPRKDGREVLRDMRADASLPPIPVLVLTTSTAKDDVCLLHRLGANCFLTKPATLEEYFDLIKAVEQFWGHCVRLPTGC